MRKLDLIADCSRCTGLCCIAHPFDRSPAFAFDKPASEPCPHLTADFRCAVHTQRAQIGCGGCIQYDCHGAGQRASRQFSEAEEPLRHRAFLALRTLHELLWLLTEALKLCPAVEVSLRAALDARIAHLDQLAAASAEQLAERVTAALETDTRKLLRELGSALRHQAQSA